jgi:hypothetical protein
VNTIKYDATSDSVVPKFLIELKKSGNEVLNILLFVLSSPLARDVAKLLLTHVLNSSLS